MSKPMVFDGAKVIHQRIGRVIEHPCIRARCPAPFIRVAPCGKTLVDRASSFCQPIQHPAQPAILPGIA